MPFPPTRRKIVPHPYAAVSEPGSTRPSPELQLRWKCLQAGRRPPASCPRISLRLPLTQPRAPAEALVQRHKSFQEAWLPWVERTCRAACCGLGGCSQAQGCELQGLPATAPPASSPSLLLFPSPAGGCGDHGAAAKWSSLFLLFLFVNPGVSCLVPSLTYSSPLHLAGRGSCAGICEDRVLWPWCCPRAVCRRPQAPPPPRRPRPSPLQAGAAGAVKPALPLSRGGCASPWGNLGGAWPQSSAVSPGRGVLRLGTRCPAWGQRFVCQDPDREGTWSGEGGSPETPASSLTVSCSAFHRAL